MKEEATNNIIEDKKEELLQLMQKTVEEVLFRNQTKIFYQIIK